MSQQSTRGHSNLKTCSRHCPVCHAASAEVLYEQSFYSMEQVGLLDGYAVVICNNCGMAYADGIPSQQEFDAYYRDLSKYDFQHRGGKESEEDERRGLEVAQTLQTLIANRHSSVLEIGCANGRMLGFLKGMGFDHVYGVDPSPACATAARVRHGVEVTAATIFDLSQCDKNYEYVILLGVLEHIRDLSRALGSVRSLLANGGKVYIEVPDASRLIPEQDAPFQEFSTEHINFFSPISLQYLMEAAGFATVACASTCRGQHLGMPSLFVSGLFQHSATARTRFPRQYEAEAGLRDYVLQCQRLDERLRRAVHHATAAGDPMVVWGVGTHTRRLLANGTLTGANIAAFVDSNPKYQGQQLNGIPVLSPESLQQRQEPVLISSYAFQHEIEQQIRDVLKLPNKVILLY